MMDRSGQDFTQRKNVDGSVLLKPGKEL
ncbi:hypothetical protein EAJ17_12275 [Akkermansia sp. aa_0143]|nr:hypothetical protein EAJ17_12275 [Akkermansia sp. aa_0143]